MKTLLTLFCVLIAFGTIAQDVFGNLNKLTPRIHKPHSLHTSDIDGNGEVDIIVKSDATYPNPDPTYILKKNGEHTYNLETLPFENFSSSQMIDINQDGFADLYSVDYNSDELSFQANDGTGNFEESVILGQVSGWISAIADVNGDGINDVVSTEEFSDYFCDGVGTWKIYIAYGTGGGFITPSEEVLNGSYDGDVRYPTAIKVADMNGDSNADLVVVQNYLVIEEYCGYDGGHDIGWFEQTADGFGTENPIAGTLVSGNWLYLDEMVVGDVDGDSDIDVVWGNGIRWAQNDGTGNFNTDFELIHNIGNDGRLALGDLEGDGTLEILSGGYEMHYFKMDSPNSFGSAIQLGDWSDGYSGTVYIDFNDFNGDNNLDAIGCAKDGKRLSIFEGDGEGDLDLLYDLNGLGLSSATGITALHLDGDGIIDLASIYGNVDQCFTSINPGNDEPLEMSRAYDAPGIPRSIEAGDLDGDGWDDVIVGARYGLYWFKNDGAGSLIPQTPISEEYGGTVELADFNGDGTIDLVCWEDENIFDRIVWYSNTDGLGTFEFMWEAEHSGFHCEQVAIDMDDDGDIDVVSLWGLDDLMWFENNGLGEFSSTHSIIEDENRTNGIDVADFNLDGHLDIVYVGDPTDGTGNNPIECAVLFNDGNGGYLDPMVLVDDHSLDEQLKAEDLDLDGDVDIVLSIGGWGWTKGVFWLENNGDGAFLPLELISDAEDPAAFDLIDMDADGLKDLVVGFIETNDGGWYQNQLGNGCIDESACNYNPLAITNDGSCCYGGCGCTDSSASNYDNQASCDNGECLYQVSGLVFNDTGSDGFYQDDVDIPLAFEQITIQPGGYTVLTNDFGQFVLDLSAGTYTIEAIVSDAFPFTTNGPIQLLVGNQAALNIELGLSINEPLYSICVDLYPTEADFLCNDMINYNICFRNEGNVTIDGVIELEYDPLFQWHEEVTPIDSVVANTLYFSFEDLPPGVMFFYDVGLQSPTVDFIGEEITNEARVFGYADEAEPVAYGQSTEVREVTCAYDPNDKQAFPEGYSDDHLLLNGTEQEFLVRFQNTGNAPAQDVVVVDTLDLNYDLSTLKIVANSHSMSVVIDSTSRAIQFQFYDIQLPDSICCEPESHGLLSYKVSPLPNLEVGTVLNNTAYIYFDNNEPIITNTTWATIHECGGESEFTIGSLLVCDDPSIGVEAVYPLLENFEWTVDGSPVGSEVGYDWIGEEEVTYEITLDASNPLCQESATISYEIEDVTLLDPCLADFSCDGHRNAEDLLIFLTAYGCVSDCAMDLTGDDRVNMSDLLVFLTLFDKGCWE